jgi:uncharacterized protein YsxB (DUF464 family)
MVKVTFTEKGNTLSLRLEGHAEYAEHGRDIVCASCAILAYTVAQFVMEAENKGDLAVPPQIDLESGNTIISCETNDDDAFLAIKNMYLFATVGYALLAHNYPQYVRLMS